MKTRPITVLFASVLGVVLTMTLIAGAHAQSSANQHRPPELQSNMPAIKPVDHEISSLQQDDSAGENFSNADDLKNDSPHETNAAPNEPDFKQVASEIKSSSDLASSSPESSLSI